MTDDKDIERCWDSNADLWARHVRTGYDTYREHYNNPAFFEFAGDLKGLAVLDAGCGEGYNTRLFAGTGARMTGVDISSQLIESARTEERGEPLGIRYEVASMSNLACFEQETFDAVVSTMALMDCPDYEGAIRELRRVLRPGGLLVFSIVHPCFSYVIGRGWERDEDGNVVGVRIGDYFQERTLRDRWHFRSAPEAECEHEEPFETVYFHRTLMSVVNPLCAAGFRIEEILEPRATDEACSAEPRLLKHQLVPQTLYVKARV